MKILFLNPHIDAEHAILRALRKRGEAILLPETGEEAWQMLQLHGASVDLAIVHREGGKGQSPLQGAEFVAKVKAEPLQADLPIIISSSGWGDVEFVNHQQSSEGANAYLQWPFTDDQLKATIESMFGGERESPTLSGIKTTTKTINDGKAIKLAENSDVRIPTPILEEPSLIRQTTELERSRTQARPGESTRRDLPFQADGGVDIPLDKTGASGLTLPPRSPVPASLPPQEDGGTQELQFSPDSPLSITLQAPGRETPAEPEGEDKEAAAEMPYLYDSQPLGLSDMGMSQPVGDAVVPGGAAHAPDAETLKRYLLLREQDVAVLSAKVKTLQQQLGANEDLMRVERAKNSELAHIVNEQKQKIDEFEKDKAHSIEGLESQVGELRFHLKTKTDKVRILDTHVREAADEMERLKERVRMDIRKIRVREKELENRLEITKKDSEVLIGAREHKIIELKRKLDTLEFNMDLLQDQYSREKENSSKLRERLVKAAQVVRVAGGFLDSPAAASLLEQEVLAGTESPDFKKQEAS